MSNNSARMLERMKELADLLTKPDLPDEKLDHYYAELREINAHLSAVDAERRAARAGK